MLDHISVQVDDVEAAVAFYTTVLAPLGVTEQLRIPQDSGPVVGLAGLDGQPRFWLSAAGTPANRELHIAFTAADRAQVDAVHELAVAEGAEVLHAPRVWTEYHPYYYGVFLRDLDGNNVEAVCHLPR